MHGGDNLRSLLQNIIGTIRTKLDFLEADVEQVTTTEELNNNTKKQYLHALQEVTKHLSLFPKNLRDDYEAKKIPESFSNKPRLITFRNNMNFMIWETNSKLHLIHDYIHSTDSVNKLSLVLNVLNSIKLVCFSFFSSNSSISSISLFLFINHCVVYVIR